MRAPRDGFLLGNGLRRKRGREAIVDMAGGGDDLSDM
ncbi:UNVERIFIED_ORG: hypothetical protein GGI57_002645 [Rhizobium aethiopicum]